MSPMSEPSPCTRAEGQTRTGAKKTAQRAALRKPMGFLFLFIFFIKTPLRFRGSALSPLWQAARGL